MTAVLASDCSVITINSDYLLVDNQTNVLTVTYNGETIYTPTILSTALSIALTNTLLGLDAGTLADGIYSIQLVTTADNGDINTETICVASLCGVHCDMVELYTDVNNAEKILAYEALKIAQGCVTCSCTTMLALYTVITNTTTNGCGCE